MVNTKRLEQSFLVKALALVIDIALVWSVLALLYSIFIEPMGLMLGMRDLNIFQWHSRQESIAVVNLMTGLAIWINSLLGSAIFVWIVYHLRLILRSVKKGTPFAKENPKRIRKVAWAVLAWGPIRLLSFFLKGRFLFLGMGKAMSAMAPMFMITFWELIFVGLGILVIAQIFERGIVLQQEHDLTV